MTEQQYTTAKMVGHRLATLRSRATRVSTDNSAHRAINLMWAGRRRKSRGVAEEGRSNVRVRGATAEDAEACRARRGLRAGSGLRARAARRDPSPLRAGHVEEEIVASGGPEAEHSSTCNCGSKPKKHRDERQCTICIGNNEGKVEKLFHCGHIFHSDCLYRWDKGISEFTEDVRVEEGVYVVFHTPRRVVCPNCRERMERSRSKRYESYVNEFKRGGEPEGMDKNCFAYKKWLRRRRGNKKVADRREKKLESEISK